MPAPGTEAAGRDKQSEAPPQPQLMSGPLENTGLWNHLRCTHYSLSLISPAPVVDFSHKLSVHVMQIFTLCQELCQIFLHGLNHLILTILLYGGGRHNPQFTDEKAEAKRGQATNQRLHGRGFENRAGLRLEAPFQEDCIQLQRQVSKVPKANNQKKYPLSTVLHKQLKNFGNVQKRGDDI